MAKGSWLEGYRAFWVYTLLRFALFFALAALLWVVGVPLLFAAVVALAISVPLSWFLLAKPRQAFAATIEQRVDRRRERTHDLDERLESAGRPADRPEEPGDGTGDAALPPGVSEAPSRDRSKRR